MIEENDQSIKEVKLISDEILGEIITLKDTEGDGRFDGELGVDVQVCIDAFLEKSIKHGVTIKMSE